MFEELSDPFERSISAALTELHKTNFVINFATQRIGQFTSTNKQAQFVTIRAAQRVGLLMTPVNRLADAMTKHGSIECGKG